jgi:hypothetical protein
MCTLGAGLHLLPHITLQRMFPAHEVPQYSQRRCNYQGSTKRSVKRGLAPEKLEKRGWSPNLQKMFRSGRGRQAPSERINGKK